MIAESLRETSLQAAANVAHSCTQDIHAAAWVQSITHTPRSVANSRIGAVQSCAGGSSQECEGEERSCYEPTTSSYRLVNDFHFCTSCTSKLACMWRSAWLQPVRGRGRNMHASIGPESHLTTMSAARSGLFCCPLRTLGCVSFSGFVY